MIQSKFGEKIFHQKIKNFGAPFPILFKAILLLPKEIIKKPFAKYLDSSNSES